MNFARDGMDMVAVLSCIFSIWPERRRVAVWSWFYSNLVHCTTMEQVGSKGQKPKPKARTCIIRCETTQGAAVIAVVRLDSLPKLGLGGVEWGVGEEDVCVCVYFIERSGEF